MRPEWLKKRVNLNEMVYVKDLLRKLSLHTVCEEANCPNISECFSRKIATFLILGHICTRNCKFCNIRKGRPEPVDENESIRVAEAVEKLGLSFVVITSVTRDDLEDGGAGIFSATVREIRKIKGGIRIELLIPDFKGDKEALEKVVNSHPEIISHNVETVPSLYPEVRSKSDYKLSLKVLENVKKMERGIYTKSGIMVGLGEKDKEVIDVMRDLREVGCDFLSIGQYLQPSKNHYPVREYIEPEKFEFYKEEALKLGFKHVKSGVYVRSSYLAEDYILNC